jgi:outer membrane protein assembly factor BamB
MKTILGLIWGAVFVVGTSNASTLYGGLGGHNNGDSTNDGSLALVNQFTGGVSVIGHPAGVSRISGLVFDQNGMLFATTQPGGGFPPPPGAMGSSQLLNLNPANGSTITSVQITDGTNGIAIADLALQPGTGILFGIRGPNDQLNGQGKLYTINKTTGLATLVGNTGDFFGSLAFAPNGTLYMAAGDLDFTTGNIINIGLKTLNPTNAATLSFIATNDLFGALAVRPEDSALFGGNSDSAQLFRVNVTTGAETLIGSTGRTFVGDLAFLPVPEPATLTLCAVGCLALAIRRRIARHSQA